MTCEPVDRDVIAIGLQLLDGLTGWTSAGHRQSWLGGGDRRGGALTRLPPLQPPTIRRFWVLAT